LLRLESAQNQLSLAYSLMPRTSKAKTATKDSTANLGFEADFAAKQAETFHSNLHPAHSEI
jgi:hypothetical protein